MKIKNIITVLLCAVFLFGMSVWCFSGTTPEYSESERRLLEEFPEVNWDKISSGKFAGEFEKYSTDRFPLRDTFRTIKAYTRLFAFMQKDNNDLYTADGHLSKVIYPHNPVMTDHATELFSSVRDKYFPTLDKDSDNKIYLAVIPDKNRFIASKNGYLSLDYDEINALIQEKMPYANYIEVADLLSADDYYYTDTHWRQDKIVDVAERLKAEMNHESKVQYKKNIMPYDFNGVYVGQSALVVEPDTITYLTNDVIDNLVVEGADGVYDMSKAKSKDPYEMFLSGTQPVIKLTNPKNTSGDRLVIFRDSFGSSIAPLLVDAYSEVVLVDLRYINSQILDNFVDFTDADILFMYSTVLLNDSLSMK